MRITQAAVLSLLIGLIPACKGNGGSDQKTCKLNYVWEGDGQPGAETGMKVKTDNECTSFCQAEIKKVCQGNENQKVKYTCYSNGNEIAGSNVFMLCSERLQANP